MSLEGFSHPGMGRRRRKRKNKSVPATAFTLETSDSSDDNSTAEKPRDTGSENDELQSVEDQEATPVARSV